MDSEQLKELLIKTSNKLEILGNVEILEKYNLNSNQLFKFIFSYLNNEEILYLFNYSYFQKLIMDLDKYSIIRLIESLGKEKKYEILLNKELIKNKLQLDQYKITRLIKSLDKDKIYEMLLNKELIKNTLQLDEYDITELAKELRLEEEKKSIIDIYKLKTSCIAEIVSSYSDSSKAKILLEDLSFGENERNTILKSFEINSLCDFINKHKQEFNISPYKIIANLDAEKQLEFIDNFSQLNLTLDEKREIMAILKHDAKSKVDLEGLSDELKAAIQIETTERNAQIILDLNSDFEQYRGLDRLIRVNPGKFNKKERELFLQLCDICPKLTVLSLTDSKDEDDILKKELESTTSEYKEAELWIEELLTSLRPEYTEIQKICIIDNAIGKKISYSPDFKTEISNAYDSRTLYKIISSGYGVCNGVARVEQYILERAGIPSEIVSGWRHSFLKLKDIEFELANGEKTVGTTIIDPTWNLCANRFGGVPKNFCISYERARKEDIINGKDFEYHRNDKELKDATFNLDEQSLRKLFKSVELADDEGNFPIKYLMDKSNNIHKTFTNNPSENIKEQFKLLKEVCPEFPTCQDSTMMILKDIIFDNEALSFDKCVINRVYNKSDKR